MIPEKVNNRFLEVKPGFPLIREMIGYASAYLGVGSRDLIDVVRGRSTPRGQLCIGESLDEVFKLGGEAKAEADFINAQRVATEVVSIILNLYNLPLNRFGFKNEVVVPDPNINRMLGYLNPRPSKELPFGTALKLRFQQAREFFLVDLALRLHKRAMDEKPYDKLSELQFLFNQRLFSGPAGDSNNIPYYVCFSDSNEVIRLESEPFPGAIKIEPEMREIQTDDGKKRVQVNFGKKSSATQIIKGIVKYQDMGIDIWDPLAPLPDGRTLLEDKQRFKIIVEKEEDISLIHRRVSNFFTEAVEKPPSRKETQRHTYKKRYIGIYKEIPIEIMYFDLAGSINNDFHVGKKNEKGLHKGSAHELYEQRRSLPALLFLFPYGVFGLPDQTEEEYEEELMSYAKKSSEDIAYELRNFAKNNGQKSQPRDQDKLWTNLNQCVE